jgi:hypothetical protein
LFFETTKRLFEMMIRAIFAAESNEVSFLFFLWYVNQSGSIENLIKVKDGN